MPWKLPAPAPVVIAVAALGLAPVACGPAAPTAAEKTKYPPGQDPESDFLPGPPAKKSAR